MNKPTVTVTPDDGCSINKMCVRESGTVASNVTAHRTLNPALYHAIERIAELEAERDEAIKQASEYENALDQVLGERDSYHDAADTLAACIERITGINNGEHSSANFPWRNAEENADGYANERDALAAHVERINEVFDSTESGWEDMEDALSYEPPTSLAQRDARIACELINKIDGQFAVFDVDMVGDARDWLESLRDEYRQQAEGEDQ